MEFIDTHCHLHFHNYDQDRKEVLAGSAKAGVNRVICVGCSLDDSQKAVEFASEHKGVWATVGAHPHDGKNFVTDASAAERFKHLLNMPKVVAIGEIGLDYYHNKTSKPDQHKILRTQMEIGLESGLPFVFHVREAWDDFWKVFDSYGTSIKGVIHSFSAGPNRLDQLLERGLHASLNGLMTYTKETSWLEAAKRLPIERMLLETDAPFLTPVPERGRRCEPRHVALTAEFLAKLRGEDLDQLAQRTTANAVDFFGLSEDKIS